LFAKKQEASYVVWHVFDYNNSSQPITLFRV